MLVLADPGLSLQRPNLGLGVTARHLFSKVFVKDWLIISSNRYLPTAWPLTRLQDPFQEPSNNSLAQFLCDYHRHPLPSLPPRTVLGMASLSFPV